jgi:hypothetical protein
MAKISGAKENRKKRQSKMDDCMKKAKTEKQKLNCKRLHINIFDPISKKQQAKQDSALYKGYSKDNIFYMEPKKDKK